MENKTIIIAASECQPFFASGGLGDVIGSLPQKLAKEVNSKLEDDKKNQVYVFLPLYSKFTKDLRNKLVYVTQLVVELSWRRQYCGIFKYVEKGVTYYFLDNEYYFKRNNYYGYFDDGERFAFFSKAIIDSIIHLDLNPDVIHVNDWQTGLVPVYLRTRYYGMPRFLNTKTIFTIHNIEYQGKYACDQDIIEDVFGIHVNDTYLLEYKGCVNIMKGAMESANIVSTVSPTYAQEILDPVKSHGLYEELLRVQGEGKLRGILNGIDKDFYNPQKDKALFVNYDKKTPSVKKQNKVELQKMLNLPVDENIPMVAMITRLVSHKGIDIVRGAFENMMNEPIQMVILGTGDVSYEGYFKDMEYRHNNKLRAIIAFNQDLSRKIYASSDIFLMPSIAEPCGLSQMIASRYGSIPLVRRTGGLADSIVDFTVKGNGYTFDNIDSNEMYTVFKRALADYSNQEEWEAKVKKVMSVDFGWTKSAKEYLKMYDDVLNK